MSDIIDDNAPFGDDENEAGYKVSAGDDQRIDLTELYYDTGQHQVTHMVQGIESFSLGQVSRRTAALLRLQGCESYDPFPSARNARVGAEGFFTTLREGFIKMIEGIIKYVKMAINWVLDSIKTLFGFRKTERVTKAINEGRKDLTKEFTKTLNGLGFPEGQYNLNKFIGELPEGKDRAAQVVLMKSKMTDDVEAMKALTEALPLFQKTVGNMVKASNNVARAQKALKETIEQEYKKSVVRDRTSGEVHPGLPEANRLAKAINEAKLAIDAKGLVTDVVALLGTLYQVKLTNEELTDGFDKVRASLQTQLETTSVQVTKVNVELVTTVITSLNARYIEVSDDEIDLRKVKWSDIGQVIDRDDTEKVKFIADHTNAQNLLSEYVQTAADVRNFANFCFVITQQLNIVQRQVANLVGWHNKATAYYHSLVIKDLETILAIDKLARSQGLDGLPRDKKGVLKFEVLSEVDAQTFIEKTGAQTQKILEHDIAGLKSNLKAFTNQIGWNPA